MNIKKLWLAIPILALGFTVATFSGCKKKTTLNEDGQASADSRNAIGENDAAISDINTSINQYSNLHGKTSQTTGITGVMSICGLTVDTNGLSQGMITLNYDGTVCSNRKREGAIKVTVIDYATGKRWKDAGCVVKLDYVGYKITRASDGKSVEFNGTQYVTNVSGGTWLELYLGSQANLISTVTGTNLYAKFDGTSIAVYNINRKFTYTWSSTNNILTCTGEGIGSNSGLNNLENYGSTRTGEPFTSQVTTPVVWNTTCGSWAPITGVVNIKLPNKNLTLNCTFGVNVSGTPVTVGVNQCPYGWKVEWTYNNQTDHRVFGYY